MSRGRSPDISTVLVIVAGIATVALVAILTIHSIARSIGRNVATFLLSVGGTPEMAASAGGFTASVSLAVMLLVLVLTPIVALIKWR